VCSHRGDLSSIKRHGLWPRYLDAVEVRVCPGTRTGTRRGIVTQSPAPTPAPPFFQLTAPPFFQLAAFLNRSSRKKDTSLTSDTDPLPTGV
jgi:hypothetical protein